jgi:hypothetical protein
VTIDSQIWTDFPSTTTTELENVLTLGRCSAADTLRPRKCGGGSTYWFHKPQNQSGNDSTYPYSVTAQLNFRSAGRHTLYVNAKARDYSAGLWAANNAHVQVSFTPNHAISARAHVTVAASTPGAV